MSWTLVTNDDGVDSPALPPLARTLGEEGRVRVVAPHVERSWSGKAITRHDRVVVEQVERDDVPMWATTGTPADGVQLGVHALFDTELPELVVSGINLGFNHGAAFLMSSGTVGAAVEGWVSGLEGVAFSTGVLEGDYDEWRRHAATDAARPAWRRLARLCAGLLDDIRDSGLLELTDVVSVNLPFDADDDTPRHVTSIARVGYDRLFQPDGRDGWVHDFGGGVLHFDALDGTDVETVLSGEISITPLRMPQAATVPDDVRARLSTTG